MELLGSHPDVCACKHKEPSYFDRNYKLGESFYKALFPVNKEHRYTVEASTNYLWYPGALEKIQEYDARSKFVVSLRNPGSRAFAEYRRRIERNGETRSFNDVFNYTGYGTKRSNYHINLVRLLSLFPRESLQVVIFEEWIANPLILTRTFGNFLGLDPSQFVVPEKERNKATVPISPALQRFRMKHFFSDQSDNWFLFRAKAVGRRTLDFVNHLFPNSRSFPDVTPHKPMLGEYYADEISKLEDLLERDLSVWRSWYD